MEETRPVVNDMKRRIDIDPDGDVLLVLEKAELRVSSKILGVTSKVLRVMFTSSFAEGIAVQQQRGSLCRITLVEDDTEGMIAVCNVLHHRYEVLPSQPSPALLETIAVISDKYDCIIATSQWVFLRLAHILRKKEVKERCKNVGLLLFPALIFDAREEFRDITKQMVYEPELPTVFQSSEEMPHCISIEVQQMLPKYLLMTIARKEWQLVKAFLSGLELLIKELVDTPRRRLISDGTFEYRISEDSLFGSTSDLGNRVCKCHGNWASTFLKELNFLNIYPIMTARDYHNLASLINTLKGIVTRTSHNVECEMCYQTTCLKVKELTGQASKGFEGLCIDCVKNGRPVAREGGEQSCRDGHEGFQGLEYIAKRGEIDSFDPV